MFDRDPQPHDPDDDGSPREERVLRAYRPQTMVERYSWAGSAVIRTQRRLLFFGGRRAARDFSRAKRRMRAVLREMGAIS